jgi:hypothetical protein
MRSAPPHPRRGPLAPTKSRPGALSSGTSGRRRSYFLHKPKPSRTSPSSRRASPAGAEHSQRRRCPQDPHGPAAHTAWPIPRPACAVPLAIHVRSPVAPTKSRPTAASSRTSERRRSYCLRKPKKTAHHSLLSLASPTDAMHSRRPAPRKTRTAPRPTLPERIEARMRNAPPQRGMLRRLRVRTAEFPLKVHVVNVAVPSLRYITPPCNVRRYRSSIKPSVTHRAPDVNIRRP